MLMRCGFTSFCSGVFISVIRLCAEIDVKAHDDYMLSIIVSVNSVCCALVWGNQFCYCQHSYIVLFWCIHLYD
jgi:hypothetical protein